MAQYDAMSTLQQNIDRVLEDRGWTKQDLANHLDMDRSQLSKIIRGQNSATVDTLEFIASGVGMNLYELFKPVEELEKISG